MVPSVTTKFHHLLSVFPWFRLILDRGYDRRQLHIPCLFIVPIARRRKKPFREASEGSTTKIKSSQEPLFTELSLLDLSPVVLNAKQKKKAVSKNSLFAYHFRLCMAIKVRDQTRWMDGWGRSSSRRSREMSLSSKNVLSDCLIELPLSTPPTSEGWFDLFLAVRMAKSKVANWVWKRWQLSKWKMTRWRPAWGRKSTSLLCMYLLSIESSESSEKVYPTPILTWLELLRVRR